MKFELHMKYTQFELFEMHMKFENENASLMRMKLGESVI